MKVEIEIEPAEEDVSRRLLTRWFAARTNDDREDVEVWFATKVDALVIVIGGRRRVVDVGKLIDAIAQAEAVEASG